MNPSILPRTTLPTRIRGGVRAVALFLVLGTMGLWLGNGAHRGWTRTTTEVRVLDEVTGIEEIRYEKRFTPGMDFLAGGLLSGLVLGSLTLLGRKQHSPQS